MNCGEATIKLLEAYGIDTVFGIPGVHTLDFCRGLNHSNVLHVQVRNEQGAGFMADGYARASGRPGVALVISGPGVTNALTAVGQAYADSIPMLLLSSDAASYTLGKGWGALHEVPSLTTVTAPLTALSATAWRPDDVPELFAQAWSIFASERPRPVHIAIPLDVLAMPAEDGWRPVNLPPRPGPNSSDIVHAAEILTNAEMPLICVGGGAWQASEEITAIAETLGAPVVASTAGKGIVRDNHPLCLGGSTVRPEVQRYIAKADAILAIGTELSETDSFVEKLDLNGKLIRVDLDTRKMNDQYPADLAIVADARSTAAVLHSKLCSAAPRQATSMEVTALRQEIAGNLSTSEEQHARALSVLRDSLPDDVVVMGDICQLVYTGAFAFDAHRPKQWHYPAGYCTLGCGLPNAVGAKLALPDRPVICLAGDGGFMFTVQELVTAAELELPIPIIIWCNDGLKQIQDDMKSRKIGLVGVEGMNPDFLKLAESCGCLSKFVDSAESLTKAIDDAFSADRPTLIEVHENDPWLTE